MDATCFTYRSKEDPDTLYVSPNYGDDEPTVFYVLCWLLLAAGGIADTKLTVPKPDSSWWGKGVMKATKPGIAKPYVLDAPVFELDLTARYRLLES